MNNNYTEDCFVGVEQGPTVRRTYSSDSYTFTVDFTDASKLHFADTRQIVHPAETVGAARRSELHRLLDEHIEDFIAGRTERR